MARGNTIPGWLLQPHVEQYLERRDMGAIMGGFGDVEFPGIINSYSGQEALAFEAGVSIKIIRKVKKGTDISFDAADKLVTAIDPSLWWRDRGLERAYREVNLPDRGHGSKNCYKKGCRCDACKPSVKGAA